MKKFLALVTLVCMVLTSTAFAQTFPSKTAQDMTTIRHEHEQEPEKVDTWSIYVTEPTELIEEVVKQMAEHVEDAPIISYFVDDIQKLVEEILPEDVDHIHDLVAYELAAVVCDGYQEEYGDAYAYFTFATVYEEDSEVMVKIGFPKELIGDTHMKNEHEEQDSAEEDEYVCPMAWSMQKSVVKNGEVCVKFLKKELLLMEEKIPALVVVLSPELTVLAEEEEAELK